MSSIFARLPGSSNSLLSESMFAEIRCDQVELQQISAEKIPRLGTSFVCSQRGVDIQRSSSIEQIPDPVPPSRLDPSDKLYKLFVFIFQIYIIIYHLAIQCTNIQNRIRNVLHNCLNYKMRGHALHIQYKQLSIQKT